MFKSALDYWRHVCRRGIEETIRWSGPVVIGIVIGFGVTAYEIYEKTVTVGHLARDYGIVLGVLFCVHVARSAWLLHNEAVSCAEDIWKLKTGLREIKRRWPNCSFVKRPTDRMDWSPLIGEPETGMSGTELEKAIEWHDEFKRVFGLDGQRCPRMNWDETMEYLDRREREKRGLPA
jgi:hypothetical protein